jgi:ribosomal protein S18 acetylase RimI-like enzyme
MVTIRPLTIEDIGQAIQLSHAERWNQTEKDWQLLIQNPQNTCLAAELDGKLIGTSTAINYNNLVAWIGMVLVNKQFRGRGVSKLLLSNLLNQLKSIRSIKLDATQAGQPVYQKFGFKNEYIIHRMTTDSVLTVEESFDSTYLPEPILPENYSEVIEFDKQIFGASRNQLIKFLVENNLENSWMIKRKGKIIGVALGRKGSRFYQVGPVLALDEKITKALIIKAIVGISGQSVVVDVLDDKKELINWLSGLGFTIQRSFVRMYQDENPYPGIPEKQFLICGPEFG